MIHKAEIFREKGTNRASYLRGEIDKYSWYDKGGSFLLSDILSLILSSQLENIDGILNDRKNTWYFFLSHLSEWAERNNFAVPFVPEGLIPSAHIFYLWSIDANQSRNLIMHLRRKGIEAMQHYQSLSQSQGYKQYGEHGDDSFEVSEIVAKGIVRLPLWFGMTQEEREFIVDGVLSFNK